MPCYRLCIGMCPELRFPMLSRRTVLQTDVTDESYLPWSVLDQLAGPVYQDNR